MDMNSLESNLTLVGEKAGATVLKMEISGRLIKKKCLP